VPDNNAIQSAIVKLQDALQAFLTSTHYQLVQDPFTTHGTTFATSATLRLSLPFFAIIFSQATSIGITNYGIKRLLPRLILIAIATNISYFICSVLIDAFNILGVGITSLFAAVN